MLEAEEEQYVEDQGKQRKATERGRPPLDFSSIDLDLLSLSPLSLIRMISATPAPSIELSLFGAMEAPTASISAQRNVEQLETHLEGLCGRPGSKVAEREVRVRCPAGGELRLCRAMRTVSSRTKASSPPSSSPSSVFDLSSAATTEWTLTQVGPPVRGRGAATLSALARPVTGIVATSGGEARVAGRHAPAFFASAGFALDFTPPGGAAAAAGDSGSSCGEVFRTGRRYRLFRSGGGGGGTGGSGTGSQGGVAAAAAAAAAHPASKSSGAAETEQISKGGASSSGSGVVVTVSLTESFSPLLPGESLSSALSPAASEAEGAAAADAAALGAAAGCCSFVSFGAPSTSTSSPPPPPPLESVSPRCPGFLLVSVTAVASESDYAAAAAQVGALAEVLRPWVELRKQ